MCCRWWPGAALCRVGLVRAQHLLPYGSALTCLQADAAADEALHARRLPSDTSGAMRVVT
jgi:hypothetical protein